MTTSESDIKLLPKSWSQDELRLLNIMAEAFGLELATDCINVLRQRRGFPARTMTEAIQEFLEVSGLALVDVHFPANALNGSEAVDKFFTIVRLYQGRMILRCPGDIDGEESDYWLVGFPRSAESFNFVQRAERDGLCTLAISTWAVGPVAEPLDEAYRRSA